MNLSNQIPSNQMIENNDFKHLLHLFEIIANDCPRKFVELMNFYGYYNLLNHSTTLKALFCKYPQLCDNNILYNIDINLLNSIDDVEFWKYISQHNQLDSNLIISLKNKLDKKLISLYQKNITPEFVSEYQEYLDMESFLKNTKGTTIRLAILEQCDDKYLPIIFDLCFKYITIDFFRLKYKGIQNFDEYSIASEYRKNQLEKRFYKNFKFTNENILLLDQDNILNIYYALKYLSVPESIIKKYSDIIIENKDLLDKCLKNKYISIELKDQIKNKIPKEPPFFEKLARQLSRQSERRKSLSRRNSIYRTNN